MRKKIIAGNWKMYKTIDEATSTVKSIAESGAVTETANNIYIAAAYPFLDRLINEFGNSGIYFGAQDVSAHEEGAFTGEVSALMLQSVGCAFALTGHSERRHYFNESDALINKKIVALISKGIQPVFCCGERMEERNDGDHFNIIRKQLENAIFILKDEDISKIIIAYEPVWAIGTGLTASPEQAEEMHAFIRGLIAERAGKNIAENMLILYGGSVKSNNAATLFSQPDIDGALVGGASLVAAEFIKIIAEGN